MSALVLIAGIVVFVVASRLAAGIGKLARCRLHVPTAENVAAEEVPAAMREALGSSVAILGRLGFHLTHFERRRESELVIDRPRWVALFFHPEERAWAEVGPAYQPEPATPFSITFVTVHATHRTVTLGPKDGLIADRAAGTLLGRATAFGYAARWHTHRRVVARVEREHVAHAPRLDLEPLDCTRRYNADVDAYYRALHADGRLIRRDGAYHLSARTIRAMLTGRTDTGAHSETDEDVGTGIGAEPAPVAVPASASSPVLASAPASGSAPVPTSPSVAVGANGGIDDEHFLTLEADACLRRHQLDSRNLLSPRFKGAALVASAVFCSLLLGHVLSFGFLVFLIPVLLLHELGHLLAMTAFGYTNKFLLFMPLGAFVSGERDDAPTWQRLVICLAGPAPGILLAFALLLWLPEIGPAVSALIAALLLVNLFNLLPVLPLDGGQIVNLAISTRFPSMQFALHVASLVLAALAAWTLEDPFLLIIAIVLGLGLKRSRANIALLKRCGGLPRDVVDPETAVRRILVSMGRRAGGFEDRYQRARELTALLARRPGGIVSSTGLLCAYALFLIAPPMLLLADTGGVQTRLVAGLVSALVEFSVPHLAETAGL